jgi:hypothetical protein
MILEALTRFGPPGGVPAFRNQPSSSDFTLYDLGLRNRSRNGFILGYGLRAITSYRRRQRATR